MKTNYRIVFEITLEKLLPSAATVVNEVNKTMESFGFNEKITLRSEFPFTLSTARPLTPDEEVQITGFMGSEINKLHPEWNTKFKYIECVSPLTLPTE